MVVYHLPQESGNFGWNVNGNSQTENFRRKRDFLKGSPNSQTEFPNGKRVYHLHTPMILPPYRLSR